MFAAMGLVAYPKGLREQNDLYKKLTKAGRWEDLGNDFEREAFALYGLSNHSMMAHTLHTGISVLKTSLCDERTDDELFMINESENVDADMKDTCINENGQCPTCNR